MKVVWIPPDLHKALSLLKIEDGISVKEHTAIALREYLDRKAQEQGQKTEAIAS